MTYLLCSAILVIFYFLLALNVSMTRSRMKVGIGATVGHAMARHARLSAAIEWVESR